MQSNAKLSVGGDPPESIDDILTRLFWKEPILKKDAKAFLSYVRQWSRSETPYRVSQWESYCENSGLTQSQYHNILRRFRRAGLIEKIYKKSIRDHELVLSKKFSVELNRLAVLWDEFCIR